jgi:hypothetical protein
MASWAEGLRHGTIRRQAPLRLSGGCEPLHAPLPLPGRLMRVCRAIVAGFVLPMCHARQPLTLGGGVALQFIGHHAPRHGLTAFEARAEALLRGRLVTPSLHEDSEHSNVLIHGAPQGMALTPQRENDCISVPLVPWTRPAWTAWMGRGLAKLLPPLRDRLLGHNDAPAKAQLCDIPVAAAEPGVQPDGVADDRDTEPMILLAVRGGDGSYDAYVTLYRPQQVDNAL